MCTTYSNMELGTGLKNQHCLVGLCSVNKSRRALESPLVQLRQTPHNILLIELLSLQPFSSLVNFFISSSSSSISPNLLQCLASR